jgi:hypothetical protein
MSSTSLGIVPCADCGGSHPLESRDGGLFRTEPCPGRKPEPQKPKIPATEFMGSIAVLVNNEELSDEDFRAFIRTGLVSVDYPLPRCPKGTS